MMHAARLLPAFIALVMGCIFALLVALLAVNRIEARSEDDVARVLSLIGQEWVRVKADGLQVRLSGTAPDEAARFRALRTAGTVVDAARLIDDMKVADRLAIAPPRFSIEILRNDEGISLIGLVPASMDREAVIDSIRKLSPEGKVVDLLDSADYPVPAHWEQALAYGLKALGLLTRSKISISARAVAVKAISDSTQEKKRLESLLADSLPEGIDLGLEISAPRPVISPYTLRFIIDEKGARFDACSTFTEAGRKKILEAARKAGLKGAGECAIGLGVPSPSWDSAVVTAIGWLSRLGGGSVTFSDADVTLVAPENTGQKVFDRVVGELKADLPEPFSLHAVLPEPTVIDGTGKGGGLPEFVATRSPEGDVRLLGRIPDERARKATESYAEARFGSDRVRAAMRIDENLPQGWMTRVLAALEAFSRLRNGSVVMQPDLVEISGRTGDENARAEIARILSEKLGASQNFRIDVTYEKKLDPKVDTPTPQECVDRINKVLKVQQITFAPSSAEIDEVARASIDNIARIMKKCEDVPMEVGGHTDSQGREVMNLALSQARAEAVVNALLARRVLTSHLVARGYGESQPIADNKTQEGRTANRRIEFRLISPEELSAAKASSLKRDEAASAPGTASSPPPGAPAHVDSQQTGNSDEQN